MARTKNEKVAVGDTVFTLKDGKIISVSRNGGNTFTAKDDNFQASTFYALILATSNHRRALTELVNKLKPSKGDVTHNAILMIQQCELTPSLQAAVGNALNNIGKKADATNVPTVRVAETVSV